MPISTLAPAENEVFLPHQQDFDLAETLDCGQAFRWNQQPDGSFIGVVDRKICHISQLDKNVTLHNINLDDFNNFWRNYFDLDRDYAQLKEFFSTDPILAKAVAYAPGIRLLRQDTWEALCCFIISQNNNVKRIKGIVDRLCSLLGDSLEDGYHAFPTPQALAACTPETLAPIRAGFRARYLIDAAQKVADGSVDLPSLHHLPIEQARAALMQITGVGVKVADCVLLYGCARIDCVPVDVWIRRALEQLFPHGLPECTKGYEGIAQQYLFHYMRTAHTDAKA